MGLWNRSPSWTGAAQAPRPVMRSVWEPGSVRLKPCQVPWSDCTTVLVCRWAKPLLKINTWVLQGGTRSAKSWVLVVAMPSLLLLCNWIPSGQLFRFSCNPCEARPEWGIPRSDSQQWGSYMSTLGLPSYLTGKTVGSGDTCGCGTDFVGMKLLYLSF